MAFRWFTNYDELKPLRHYYLGDADAAEKAAAAVASQGKA